LSRITRTQLLEFGPGEIVPGQFILTNPRVMAGDLLVPDPEPTIVRLGQPAEAVAARLRAVITDMTMESYAATAYSIGSYTTTWLPRQVRLRIVLEVQPGAMSTAYLRPGNVVDLSIVG
jgi:hypothetical protein